MATAWMRAFGSWWEAHERSESWQKGVFYALSAGYALLALSALLLLSLSYLVLCAHGGRLPLLGWVYSKLSDSSIADIHRRKRLWLLPLLLFALIRANGFYALAYSPRFPFQVPLLTAVLLDLPGLLLFSTCTLFLLSLWVDLCHRPSLTEPSRWTKPVIIAVNAGVYMAQVLMWAGNYLIHTRGGYVLETAARLAFAALWIAAGIAFWGYGVTLRRRLGKRGSWGQVRRRMRSEVTRLTMICVLLFAGRACIISSSAIYDRNMHADVRRHPLINLVFYVGMELQPCAILVFLKRQLPGKLLPVSNQPVRSDTTLRETLITPTIQPSGDEYEETSIHKV